MVKLKLKKITRRYATLLVGLLFVVAAVYLYQLYHSPLQVEESYRVYSYLQESNIEHKVIYGPDQPVTVVVDAPLKAYITDLTEEIETDFYYNFTGQREAVIEGQLRVEAEISALAGKERYLVWQENYPLLESKSFNAEGKEFVIQEKVIIPFQDYVVLSQNIQEQTKFIPDELILSVKYYIDLTATTGSGVITESLTPELVVPLRGKTFVVEGSLKSDKEDGIMGKRLVPVLMMAEKRIASAVAAAVLLVLLLACLLFTEDAEKELDPIRKRIIKIFKKYGDRIVSYKQGPSVVNSDRVFYFGSFEDLLKVADELNKPILYNDSQADEASFYVFAEDTYVYRVKSLLGTLKGIKEAVLHV